MLATGRRVVDPVWVKDPPEVISVEPETKPLGRQFDAPLTRHPHQSEHDLRHRSRRGLSVVAGVVEGRDHADSGPDLVARQLLDGHDL